MSEQLRFSVSLRKTFLLNGEAAKPGVEHAPYLKVAYNLLENVLSDAKKGGLPQRERTITLSDGTRITARKRFDQNDITIDVPTIHVPERHETQVVETVDTIISHEEPKIPEERVTPYLWVGARIAWDRIGADNYYEDDALNVQVFEPGVAGIVGNFPVFNYSASGGSNSYAPINPRPDGVVPLWWDSAITYSDSVKAQVCTTQHGLYMTAMSMPNQWSNPLLYDGPGSPHPTSDYFGGPEVVYDPQATAAQLAARTRPIYYDDSFYGPNGLALWDAVTVLDPYPEMEPGDNRDNALNIPQMIDACGLPAGDDQVLPGQYVVKVGAFGACMGPVEVDIEVRVNKQPFTQTHQFSVTVDVGSDWYNNLHPYGQFIPSGISQCPDTDSRNNPHGNCWWQGAILVDVQNGLVSSSDFHVPEHGFDPAKWLAWWECPGSGPVVTYIASKDDTVNGAPIWQFAGYEALNYSVWDMWGGPEKYPLTDTGNAIYEAAQQVVTRSGLYRHEIVGGINVFTRVSDFTDGMWFGWSMDITGTVTPILQQEIDAGAYYASFHCLGWASMIYLQGMTGDCPEI